MTTCKKDVDCKPDELTKLASTCAYAKLKSWPSAPSADEVTLLSIFNNPNLKKEGDSGFACMPQLLCQVTYDASV